MLGVRSAFFRGRAAATVALNAGSARQALRTGPVRRVANAAGVFEGTNATSKLIFSLKNKAFFRSLGYLCAGFSPFALYGSYTLIYREPTDLTDMGGQAPKARWKYQLLGAGTMCHFLVLCMGMRWLNTKLIGDIVLLPKRRIRISTVGVFKQTDHVFKLDQVLPPFAVSGHCRSLQKVQVAQPTSNQWFLIFHDANSVPKESNNHALCTRIFTNNPVINGTSF